MKPILGILGPTAVGKSKLALNLAQQINTEIISADSMQIYKKFDIGTAKASLQERTLVKHHLIDIAEPYENFSSYLFKIATEKVLKEFEEKDKVPLIVGGTGFFFNNLLFEFDFEEGQNQQEIRQKLQEDLTEHGKEYMHNKLEKLDPESAKIIHLNDTKKVLRAIEIFLTTGRAKSSGTNLSKAKYPYILFVLNKPREILYEDINKRVDIMIADGLEKEVRELYETLPKNSQSLAGIGYKELIKYFNGEISKDQAIELIKQHSRNYAKRQITFYKKMDAIWLDAQKSTDELIFEIKRAYFEKFSIKI